MGLRGPPKKPTEIAIIDGSYKPSVHGDKPLRIAPTVVNLEPPRAWTAAKKKAWRDLTRNLVDGLVQEADLAALEMAAVQLVTFREADAHIAENGLMVERVVWNREGQEDVLELILNPMLKVRDKAAQEFRAWCVRFGFDPASRVSLGLGAIKSRSMAADLESKLKPPGGS